jgi:uncharacterized RmlC-like cupin family protein
MTHDRRGVILRRLGVNETGEGITIPLYRDTDLRGNVETVRMAYVTTIKPGMKKGPILHRRRHSMVMALGGAPSIRYPDRAPEDGMEQLRLSIDDEVEVPLIVADGYFVAEIPPGTPVQFINRGTATTTLFVVADYAWRPNDDEATKYSSWDEYWETGK